MVIEGAGGLTSLAELVFMASDELMTKALADIFAEQCRMSDDIKTVKKGLSKAIEGLQEAVTGMDSLDTRSDAILEALRGMAERAAEAAKWRRRAEERLAALEAWKAAQEAS